MYYKENAEDYVSDHKTICFWHTLTANLLTMHSFFSLLPTRQFIDRSVDFPCQKKGSQFRPKEGRNKFYIRCSFP